MTEVGIFIFAMGAGLAGSIIGTYVTRQTDAAVLRNFYLKTRPFGLWGALKHELPAHERETVSREHRNDLLAAPFALLWHVSMFLTPMLVVIKHWQAAGWCFALWLTGAAGLYWFWYRNLPTTNWYGDSVEKLGAANSRDAPEESRRCKHKFNKFKKCSLTSWLSKGHNLRATVTQTNNYDFENVSYRQGSSSSGLGRKHTGDVSRGTGQFF